VEAPELETDPYLKWVQDALTRQAPTDPRTADELIRLRELAAATEHDIAHSSLGRRRKRAGNRLSSGETMDREWVARWLSFDVDRLVEVDEPLPRPHPPNSVLLDHTTINLAATYIDHGQPPSPLGFLDLANFVNNRVLRDDLLGLGYRLGTGSFQRTMQDEVESPGRIDSAITAATLLSIRRLNSVDPLSTQERDGTAETWSTILGDAAPSTETMFAVPIEDALYYLNAPESRKEGGGDNLTAYLINRLFDTKPPSDPEERRRAVQAANCRALLNLEAARHLDVPYAGGITRLPMKRIMWQRGRQSDAVLSAVTRSDLRTVPILDGEYRKKVNASLAARQRSIVLPVFLAAVLARTNRLSEFYECTDDLRREAEPLRRRLAEIEEAFSSSANGEVKETQKLLTAFQDNSKWLRRTFWDVAPAASAVAGVVLTAATGEPAWLTAMVAMLKAGDTLKTRTWDRLANRVWRRHLWFVTELGGMSDSLVDVTPRLERLWGPHFGERFRERLDRLSALGTL
jgi:hypothetical protein